MSSVPVWLQVAAHVVAILAGTGGILFGLLVLWPSIRKQNRFIEAQVKKGVDDLIDSL